MTEVYHLFAKTILVRQTKTHSKAQPVHQAELGLSIKVQDHVSMGSLVQNIGPPSE